MIGYQELLIIFVLVLLFFGGRKIPEVARGLGKGLNEFKKAKDGITDSIHEAAEDAGEKEVAAIATDEESPKKSKKSSKKKGDKSKSKSKKKKA